MNTEDMIQKIGINWDTDFYNRKHTNYLGAEKYTSFLAEYLVDNYDFEDHRNDSAYVEWHESYDRYYDRTRDSNAAEK